MTLVNDRSARHRGVDLHAHTTASDGSLSPRELVRLAADRDLSVLAVTDHDTTTGLDEAAMEARSIGIRLVPGVELGADLLGAEVHLLGYHFDPHYSVLLRALEKMRQERLVRLDAMLEKLQDLDMKVSRERVLAIAGMSTVGRPHLAMAMMEAGHVQSIDEALQRYLGHSKPAYVPRTQTSIIECIGLIHEAGGVAVLAHPTKVNNVEDVLPVLVEAGLDGLEVYYGEYDSLTKSWLRSLAEKYALICTGGSDFHGLSSLSHAQLASVEVPWECVENLEERARDRRAKHGSSQFHEF
ncbi:MAG: PHP domain-containing protein [Chloroflexota bacterium]|nr:PHP domain-containing protein [Chloroflexota bacterium]MDQ5865612.1 PHP domain-containing protein [Chloroflexota bacterium]